MLLANYGIVVHILSLPPSSLSASAPLSFGLNFDSMSRGDLGGASESRVAVIRRDLCCVGVASRQGELNGAGLVSLRGLLILHD